MMEYQQIPKMLSCPVCCEDKAYLLWSTNNEQAAQHFVLKEKYPERFLELSTHIEKLWGQDICEVVQCQNCGFVYSNPYVAGDERFYHLAYVSHGYPKWKWEFQLTYDVLNNFSMTSGIRLLEIGAGDGAFVKRIAGNILPKENITCTEYSEYGRCQMKKIGIKCLSEDIRSSLNFLFEKELDIICLFQVLEHMDRLEDLFQKLNLMMKKGGNLFISVPNQKRIQFNELNGALLDMPPNHIGRWNKECFEKVGNLYGFYIEQYAVEKPGFISIAKQFIAFRLLLRSQQSGSFENKIFKIKNRYLLRLMQMVGMAFNALKAIPVLFKIDSGLGNSQWIHLIKTGDCVTTRDRGN